MKYNNNLFFIHIHKLQTAFNNEDDNNIKINNISNENYNNDKLWWYIKLRVAIYLK